MCASDELIITGVGCIGGGGGGGGRKRNGRSYWKR